MLNRHAEAQQLYRDALARTPGDTETANDLALSLMLSGQNGRREGRPGAVSRPRRSSRTDADDDGSGGRNAGRACRDSGAARRGNSKPAAPTSLKAPPVQAKKPAKARPAPARSDRSGAIAAQQAQKAEACRDDREGPGLGDVGFSDRNRNIVVCVGWSGTSCSRNRIRDAQGIRCRGFWPSLIVS